MQRPPLHDISKRVQADFSLYCNDGKPLRKFSKDYVLSQVIAGVSHLLHGRLNFIENQLFPDTCTNDRLEQMASSRGVFKRKALHAQGAVMFSGIPRKAIPQGTELTREDAVLFKTLQPGVIARDGQISIDCQCNTLGDVGNTSGNTVLTLVSPLSGVDSQARVRTSGIIHGVDEESRESLQARYLMRLQNPIRGGTKSDYEQWMLEVPGVKKPWVYSNVPTIGTVSVAFTIDDIDAPFPTSAEIQTMEVYLRKLKPITAKLQMKVCTPKIIPITVRLSSQDPIVRSRIEASIKRIFFEEAKPGGLLLVSHLILAISNSITREDFSLVSPTENIQAQDGELHHFGGITWQ